MLSPPIPILIKLGIDPKRICHMSPGPRRTQCRAIINWLTRHGPKTNNNLEQVKGYLEAFYHLCDIEEWERAFSLVSVRPNTPTQEPLHYQLKLWGYSQIRIDLYKALANRIHHRPEDGWNARILQFLGESFYTSGQYQQAKTYYERSLAMFKRVGTPGDVGMLMSALGDVYYAQGQYDKAIEHQAEWLASAQKDSTRFAEGIALGSLGNIYEAKGDYYKAIEYHQRHLAIAQETKDLEMEGAALGNLGSCYHSLNQYNKAKNYHEQHLTLAREIGNRQGESNALGGVGSALYSLCNYASARDYFS